MIYLQLLWVYLKIGMFGFGGGYAMLSLIQHEIVDIHHWLTPQQFTDVVAISQMTPGPIGINSATYVGYAVTQSVWGAVLATVAVCLPSFILVLLISYFFAKCKDNKYIKAKNFIASHQEEPFFLYMGTQDVHVPRIPHPRFAGKSGLGTRGDVILQLDWTIGEIMHTLDSLHIADNTILIFTSDNGPVIDDGYQDQAYELLNGHTPMGIYRGGKYSAYEAGTRVPFIVRWPARVKPNKQQALFSQIDVYASLASLLDQPLRKGAAPDSQEHLNVLLGKNNTNREYVVQQNLNNTLAIIKGQWKYIEPSDGPAIEYWTKMELGNDKQPQLYDLSSDPSEKTNVSKQYPDIVKELSELLESVKEK